MSVEAENAYAAGLFDGEGCVIFFERGDGGWQLELSLSNCDERALYFMQRMFGGSVRETFVRRNANRHPIGIWHCSGLNAERAAQCMVSFSILKRKQLQLFLVGRQTVVRKGERITPKTIARRRKIANQIASLKRPELVLR
jgi:hypothetical protein